MVAMLILRFDHGTVITIAWLFGVICFVVAANEVTVGVLVAPSRGWLVLHVLLAALLVVVGAVALVRPDYTFFALAAVMSFYFVFRGAFDVATALAFSTVPGWWVLLLVGLAELALGFWAAGSWKASATVLVVWVAAATLVHGVGQIAGAFILRRIHHGLNTFQQVRPRSSVVGALLAPGTVRRGRAAVTGSGRCGARCGAGDSAPCWDDSTAVGWWLAVIRRFAPMPGMC
jgi:uncharacterized membrane protein HdeD (DUF308 family)